ncbi:hypothetical protein BJ322DRAFT_501297 [Thelephora terrestris]|uniref:Uncharacterized protein n=1 Tax=Thelephora terrestris TaxID=56493 RepID=A0A9P6H2Q8_9AGAM|nr:hypothetical protein BJ322DRAFT_501297 [Thelephora terrestris]
MLLVRGAIKLGNLQDNFDVSKFLRGTLEELPPMPNPVVAAREGVPRPRGVTIETRKGKSILYVNGDNTIQWANKGGGCVVPFPPAIYNGKTHVVEQSHNGTVENRPFELFGADGHVIYYGTYRCIKVVSMNWGALISCLGQEFSNAFLETTVIQDGHAAPVTRSLMESMYKSGILKATCAVLRCEGFDEHMVMKQAQSAAGPVTHNNGKRLNYHGEGSQGKHKRAKLTGGKLRTLGAHRNTKR